MAVLALCFMAWSTALCAQTSSARRVAKDTCPRPAIGGAVPEPEDLRSHDGVLKVELTVRNAIQADGSTRYCYMDAHGAESPNLRLHPGDLLILTLKNDLVDPHAGDAAGGDHMQMQMHGDAAAGADPCSSGLMTATSTNLHFHGLTIPPTCHQDEVLKTSIQPGDAPFEYRFRIHWR